MMTYRTLYIIYIHIRRTCMICAAPSRLRCHCLNALCFSSSNTNCSLDWTGDACDKSTRFLSLNEPSNGDANFQDILFREYRYRVLLCIVVRYNQLFATMKNTTIKSCFRDSRSSFVVHLCWCITRSFITMFVFSASDV